MHGWLNIQVHDRAGRLIREVTEPIGSPVVAFLELLRSFIADANTSAVMDIGGTNRTVQDSGTKMAANGPAGNTNRGIVAGTGAVAVDIADYKLGALIAHGVGAGQLSYAAQTNPADVTTSDPNVTFQISRVLTNTSGGAITISEVGIYAQHLDDAFATQTFCIDRNVPVTPLAVPNGGAATITYTYTMTE